jgi:Sporulation and spore germination/Putative peptidoglycan binding domain/L,D-transpeptidase catalytic domain
VDDATTKVRFGCHRFVKALGLLAVAAALAGGGAASTAARARTSSVFFVRGEQLAPTRRPVSAPVDAVRALLAGPTRSERRVGFRTYIPAGTGLHAVTVADGLVTVDLSARFVAGRDPSSLSARLSQLVRTVTAPDGPRKVQLLVDGAKVSGVFPGIPTERPITFALLQRPDLPVPKPRRRRLPPPDNRVKQAQRQLIKLGYLPAGAADGRLGPFTQEAILAFQKWERLNRTDVLDRTTLARLAAAARPAPLNRGGSGKRAEVLIDRQVALLIVDNRVVMAIAVSTGKPSTPTPPGNYHVYAKIPRWWSVPFREWLPWAVPFVGGIAFHEFAVVPAYAASHGCVRQSYSVARMTFNFAEVGMPVRVVART